MSSASFRLSILSALVLGVAASSAHATPVETRVDVNPAPKAVDAETRARMRTLAASIDTATTPAEAERMTLVEQAALADLARDESEPTFVRARALGLVGAIRNDVAENLWAEARGSRNEALRVQAAWGQLTARLRSPEALDFDRGLLASDDVKIREVGVHGLFLLKSDEAIAVARAHRATEQSPFLQKLIDRRLREAAKKK